MKKRFLIPGFLKQYDNYLLTHKPDTWSLRTHLFTYFALLFALLTAIVCFGITFDPREYSSIEMWTGLTAFLLAVSIVLWFIYLFRFNVFKRFAHINTANYALKSFLHYTWCSALLVGICYIPAIVENTRAKTMYPRQELIQDINTINHLLVAQHRDSLQKGKMYTYKILLLKDSLDKRITFDSTSLNEQRFDLYENERDGDFDYYGFKDDVEKVLKSANAASEMRFDIKHVNHNPDNYNFSIDSFRYINDSMLVGVSLPNYTFLDEHKYRYFNSNKLTTHNDLKLYNDEILHRITKPDSNKLMQLLGKYITYKQRIYGYDAPSLSTYDTEANDGHAKKDPFLEKYPWYDKSSYGIYTFNTTNYMDHHYREINQASESIEQITDKQDKWENDNWEDFTFPILFISYILAMFIFLYRNNTVKSFFLSILFGIILAVVLGIALVVVQVNSIQGMLTMLVTYLIITIAGYSTIKQQHKKIGQVILMNISNFFLFIIPFFVSCIYYEWMNRRYIDNKITSAQHDAILETKHLVTNITLLGGVVLSLVFLYVVMSRYYRYWYSLPEE